MNDFGFDGTVKTSAKTATRTLRVECGSGTSDETPSFVENLKETAAGRSKRPISQGPKAEIREELRNDEEEAEEIERNQATHWWFTSTAFPLIAGTFGPIANLFSVCALVMSWRVALPDGGKIQDPAWLIVMNVVSVFFALAANIFLLLNFAHRVRYSVAQPLTISLWYISSVFLFVPLGLTGAPFMGNPPHALSQSFYYGLIAGVLYFVISTLLLLNSLGANKFHAYPPSFNALTLPQRTLMLQTISFSLYLALGSGVFSALEGWSFLDGLYWADYTLLTIGIGSDFPLETAAGRMLLIPFSAFGITLIGLVVGSVRGLVMERAKAKVVWRRLGKEREMWKEHIVRRRSQLRIQEHAQPPQTPSPQPVGGDPAPPLPLWKRLMARGRERKMKRKESRLPAELVDINGPYDRGPWKRAEFELMRHVESTSAKAERYTYLSISALTFLFVWIGGSLVFWSCEHNDQSWTYPQSLYFSYTSITTIGYGDFYPISSAGRPFFVIWSLIAVPTVTVLISTMGDTVVKGIEEATIWLGRRTILPELPEDYEQEECKGRRNRLLRGRWKKHRHHDHQPAQVEQKAQITQFEREGSIQGTSMGADIGKLGQKVEEAEERRNHGDSLAARLAREIGSLAKDVGKKPPIKYEWDEWLKWFELLEKEQHGVDAEGRNDTEGDEERTVVQADNNKDGDEVGEDDGMGVREVNVAMVVGGANNSQGKDQGKGSQLKKEWTWTWLGDDGPLFSRETETEWILEKLCIRLEEALEDELNEKR